MEMDRETIMVRTGRMYFDCLRIREKAVAFGVSLPEPWAPGPRHDAGASIFVLYSEMLEQYDEFWQAYDAAKSKFNANA